jgi:hypothetical protein
MLLDALARSRVHPIQAGPCGQFARSVRHQPVQAMVPSPTAATLGRGGISGWGRAAITSNKMATPHWADFRASFCVTKMCPKCYQLTSNGTTVPINLLLTEGDSIGEAAMKATPAAGIASLATLVRAESCGNLTSPNLRFRQSPTGQAEQQSNASIALAAAHGVPTCRWQ